MLGVRYYDIVTLGVLGYASFPVSRSTHMFLALGLLRFCIGSFVSYSLMIYEGFYLTLNPLVACPSEQSHVVPSPASYA